MAENVRPQPHSNSSAPLRSARTPRAKRVHTGKCFPNPASAPATNAFAYSISIAPGARRGVGGGIPLRAAPIPTIRLKHSHLARHGCIEPRNLPAHHLPRSLPPARVEVRMQGRTSRRDWSGLAGNQWEREGGWNGRQVGGKAGRREGGSAARRSGREGRSTGRRSVVETGAVGAGAGGRAVGTGAGRRKGGKAVGTGAGGRAVGTGAGRRKGGRAAGTGAGGRAVGTAAQPSGGPTARRSGREGRSERKGGRTGHGRNGAKPRRTPSCSFRSWGRDESCCGRAGSCGRGAPRHRKWTEEITFSSPSLFLFLLPQITAVRRNELEAEVEDGGPPGGGPQAQQHG
jgi:hypothetical protein